LEWKKECSFGKRVIERLKSTFMIQLDFFLNSPSKKMPQYPSFKIIFRNNTPLFDKIRHALMEELQLSPLTLHGGNVNVAIDQPFYT
jgi:hypothetical protein